MILRILLEQVFHGIALFFELVDAEVDLLLAEGIDGYVDCWLFLGGYDRKSDECGVISDQ
ncbi:MAG: hypothetical protein CAK88_07205 [Verrucomicrobiia bacterium AMD-G2]|nr:MAG: hypothetical protein CAK88_07205 [Verrucomicrobiae bacterium AMD-G2]